MDNLITDIRKSLKDAQIEASGKDIIIKSKDRNKTKQDLEKALKQKKYKFKSVFKKAKSSSIDVLTIDNRPGDIIFKPIIQKGAGGVSFEKDLAIDLTNYFNGVPISKLKNQDVLKEMEKVLKISPKDKYVIAHEGSKNQRRELQYTKGNLSVSNSTGATLTDITLQKGTNKIYLSLKMSKSYYILSASIFKYFLSNATNSSLCEFLGLDGMRMGGFGKEYFCKTKKPNYNAAASNIQKFLANAYGTNVVIIHKKKENDVMVSNVERTAVVKVSGLSADSYVYPEDGVRKYAAIKFNADINKHKYIVNFQFRGTTAADKGPKYLRILMERL